MTKNTKNLGKEEKKLVEIEKNTEKIKKNKIKNEQSGINDDDDNLDSYNEYFENDDEEDDIGFIDRARCCCRCVDWSIKDWVIKPFIFLFIYGYLTKIFFFVSWYMNKREEMIDVFARHYNIEPVDVKISIFSFTDFSYPSVGSNGEASVANFFSFWDLGHIIYCFFGLFFVGCLKTFFKAIYWFICKIISSVVDPYVRSYKRKRLNNKKKSLKKKYQKKFEKKIKKNK